MLQMMQRKVTAEGATAKELYDKYRCSCEASEATLSKSISDAETRIPQLQSDLNAGDAEKTQLASEIRHADEGKSEAQKTMAESKTMRAKEAAAHAQEAAEDTADLAAMDQALTSLKKGAGDAFLQTSGAAVLQRFTVAADLPEWDRRTLAAFLSSGTGDQDSQGEGYEPDSQDLIGIISQIRETASKDLEEAGAAEKKAVADYDALVGAKTKEEGALSKELESKAARQGEVGVELVNLAQDLSDTTQRLAQDRDFLADLTKGCKTVSAEWDVSSQTRADELAALADAIKLLSDDSTLALLRHSIATPSLMQVRTSSRQLLHEAQQVLRKQVGGGPRDPRLSLISMAMQGRKANFDKVQVMIDKMIALLGKEQKDDDAKKSYCKEELDKAEDEQATLGTSISDSTKMAANSKQMVTTLSEDILKTALEIKALDKAVAEATKQRKNENAAFVEELASNSAAIEILTIAKKRLNEFYNPRLIQSTPKQELSQTDAITGTLAPAESAPVGSAGTGVVALQDAFSFLQLARGAAPAPSSASFVEVQKADSGGVIALMNTLIKDIQKEVVEMQAGEKDAQGQYERFMAESSEKHAADAKALSAKESTKANTEAAVQKHSKELKTATAEANANSEYLQSLHQECDWMLQNFNVRQDARTSEIASLKQAMAVLSGADYSFLQLHGEVKHNLRRSTRPLVSS